MSWLYGFSQILIHGVARNHFVPIIFSDCNIEFWSGNPTTIFTCCLNIKLKLYTIQTLGIKYWLDSQSCQNWNFIPYSSEHKLLTRLSIYVVMNSKLKIYNQYSCNILWPLMFWILVTGIIVEIPKFYNNHINKQKLFTKIFSLSFNLKKNILHTYLGIFNIWPASQYMAQPGRQKVTYIYYS